MSYMRFPPDQTTCLDADHPRLASLVAASSDKLMPAIRNARNAKRLERLMIAARTLGAERRMGPRMPFSQRAVLEIGLARYPTSCIDIGRRGIMMEKPVSMVEPAALDARIAIENLGSFAARIVALDGQTVSLAFKPCDGNPAHDGLMRLITSLERQNADAIAVSARFARDISEAFAVAVAERRITLTGLFATELRRIEGTDPPQFDHPAMAFFEAVLPAIMARYCRPEANVAYAVATTRTCFVPVHHAEMSQPQRQADPGFNHAWSRHRRIYDDRWTLRAAAFSPHPVVQAYRRDVPEGPARLVREVSAPILVRDRHWGAAQIGYLMGQNQAGP